jgi:diguanylate cyclase (GGDEF)-like protein
MTSKTPEHDPAPGATGAPQRRLRVLVAEDGRVSRHWLVRTLQQLGHETIEAEDGERAWQLFHERAPDVVITDWIMPGINGLELCRRIRLESSSAYVYLIVTTVLEDRQHILEGLAAGADDYLVKPVFAEDLQARMIVAERVTSLHRAGSQTLAHRDMLLQLARRFASETDPESLLSDALSTAVHLLGADAAIVYRWDETDRALFAVRSTLWDNAQVLRVELGHGAAGRACLLGDPVVIEDCVAEDAVSTLLVQAGIRVALAAPLMHEGRLLGAVEVGSQRSDRPFSVADGDTLELLAGSVASAIVSLRHATAMRTLSDTDPLTGLATQRKAADVLNRYLKLAQRRSRTVAVAVVNLDRLEDINSTHGQSGGDAVVQSLGSLLTHAFRGEDIVARWDGEMFLIGMFDMPTTIAALRLKAVQKELGDTPFVSATGERFSATFSAGIARFPEDATQLVDLTASAEKALARAKRAGSGGIALADRHAPAAPAAA